MLCALILLPYVKNRIYSMTDNNSNTSSTELSDLCTLKPFDMEPRRKSAVKTLHSVNVNPKFIISEFYFRVLQYAACKQYTCWIHSRLGKGVRKVIPFGQFATSFHYKIINL